MATLADVASAAGVSTATVSLVLSGKAEGRVAKATAERVQAAADEAGYVRNAVAGSLRSRSTRTLGLVSERSAASGAVLADVLAVCREAGWSMLVTDLGHTPKEARDAVHELRQRRVDAVIYAPTTRQKVHVDRALEHVAVLNGYADRPGVPGAVADEETGAVEAVGHLLALGHRRIAHLTLDRDEDVTVRLRQSGYSGALAAAGPTVDPGLVVTCDGTPSDADRAARALLDRHDRPTAVFCYDDALALGVYRQARALGLRLPDDLSVIGFDELAVLAENVAPRLTTLRLPRRDMAEWVTSGLIGGAGELPPIPTVFTCELIERGSTAPPAA